MVSRRKKAIWKIFLNVIYRLLQLQCAWHLQQRHEKVIDGCHQKSSVAYKHKASYKKKIIWDIQRLF